MASFGANRWQTICKDIFSTLFPALLTGFAGASLLAILALLTLVIKAFIEWRVSQGAKGATDDFDFGRFFRLTVEVQIQALG